MLLDVAVTRPWMSIGCGGALAVGLTERSAVMLNGGWTREAAEETGKDRCGGAVAEWSACVHVYAHPAWQEYRIRLPAYRSGQEEEGERSSSSHTTIIQKLTISLLITGLKQNHRRHPRQPRRLRCQCVNSSARTAAERCWQLAAMPPHYAALQQLSRISGHSLLDAATTLCPDAVTAATRHSVFLDSGCNCSLAPAIRQPRFRMTPFRSDSPGPKAGLLQPQPWTEVIYGTW
jgi:hypothetical protein